MCFYVLNIFYFLAVNVSGNVQIKIILRVADFSIGNKTAKLRHFQLLIENIYNFVNVLLSQTVFVTVFYKAFTGINQKNSFFIIRQAFSSLGIFKVNYNNAGRNARTIKQVGR